MNNPQKGIRNKETMGKWGEEKTVSAKDRR